ncbi:lipase maturation factor-domain-containing protein, partial [Ochromonadaceae sp. CCMP2298]
MDACEKDKGTTVEGSVKTSVKGASVEKASMKSMTSVEGASVKNVTSEGTDMDLLTDSYWLTRILFLRCLGLLYATAFLVALLQNEALIGENGLTPATTFLSQRPSDASTYQLISQQPTLFWILPPTTLNLHICAGTGLTLSLLMSIQGAANMPLLFLLWALYFSIVSVGQTWYSFGWESQLLETGFLAMISAPLLSLSRFSTPTPWVLVWGSRWLLFRIMIGAGMIKIRGDECWTLLTCMDYFFETQPIPNPLSLYLHFSPLHRVETAANHVVELLMPPLLLLPHRRLRFLGGGVQILFQFVLILSGNLSFLNWLTALPALLCFDDRALSLVPLFPGLGALFSDGMVKRAVQAERTTTPNPSSPTPGPTPTWTARRVSLWLRHVFTAACGLLLVYKSYPVVKNLLNPNQ